MKLWLAAVFLSLLAMLEPVSGQIVSDKPATTACPTAADVGPLQLYGQWLASIEGQAGSVSLRFEKHPERSESVAGSVSRAEGRSLLAGDVDGGQFHLEESIDGYNISAVWSGTVVTGSCGREIRGTWRRAGSELTQAFVLRKTPGWQ